MERIQLEIQKTARSQEAAVRPMVHLVPYICEQGDIAYTYREPPFDTEQLVGKIMSVIPDGSVKELGVNPHTSYWGSDFHAFRREIWKDLAPISFVVSHGNFMRKQVCVETESCSRGVPNGGVLCMRNRSKLVFFVRHCATCHNIDKTGSATLTMCYRFRELDAVKNLARAILGAYGRRMCGFYSSPLPRAIVTCVFLQRDISEDERLRLCRNFGACANHIETTDLERHEQKHDCDNSSSPFCVIQSARQLSLLQLLPMRAS